MPADLEPTIQEQSDQSSILEGFMRRDQLAQALRLSQRTLIRLAATKSGPPYIRVGKTIFYRRESVLEWLHSKEQAHKLATRRRKQRVST